MLSKIRDLLRYAITTTSARISGGRSIHQVGYFGKIADALSIYPYGMYANMPPSELVVMVAIEGNAENRALIGCSPPSIPDLKQGEVALYHPGTGSIVKMSSGGDITIRGGTIAITGDVTITGDLKVGAAQIDFLTHTHIGSPTAATGPVTPTGAPIP